MLLKQPGILAISLQAKSKASPTRDGTNQEIHANIGEHSRKDDA
jgi:hypothetical protein